MKATKQNLMNIDSERLVLSDLENAKVGDTFHKKGRTITNWGSTWRVVRETPKTVEAELVNLWFPVFKKTAFGRVAKGEDERDLSWLKESEAMLKGKRSKFWRNGKEFGDDFVSVVSVW